MTETKKVWRKLGSNPGTKTDRTWSPETEKTLEGKYVEMKNIKTKEGKQVKLYVIKDSKGKLVGVWGAAMLDRLMAEAIIGEEVKITFLRKSYNKETGRYLKEFTVEALETDNEEPKNDETSDKDIPF